MSIRGIDLREGDPVALRDGTTATSSALLNPHCARWFPLCTEWFREV